MRNAPLIMQVVIIIIGQANKNLNSVLSLSFLLIYMNLKELISSTALCKASVKLV